jgi:putative copper export protein
MTLRAVILWLHVTCGVVWIGACAAFLLAVTLSASEPEQSYEIVVKILPRINRICLPLVFAIPVTGMGNLLFVAQARGLVLPIEFISILLAKVSLLAVMSLGLAAAWRAEQKFKAVTAIRPSEICDTARLRQIVASYGVIVGAGILALGLGLWLSGT